MTVLHSTVLFLASCAQGGDPTGTGAGGPGYSIPCETDGNPHRHLVGSLSMAHAGRNTGGSQFFIVHEPQPHLDGVHTVFGKATSGIETVLKMRQGDVMKEVKVWEEYKEKESFCSLFILMRLSTTSTAHHTSSIVAKIYCL